MAWIVFYLRLSDKGIMPKAMAFQPQEGRWISSNCSTARSLTGPGWVLLPNI